VQSVNCVVVLFQNIYVQRKWRIRKNTKKRWIKKGMEEGENEGVKEGRKRDRVRN
jgi:hypothetical protein